MRYTRRIAILALGALAATAATASASAAPRTSHDLAQAIRPITTFGVGLDPEGIAVNPLSGKIYVDNFGQDTVQVIDGQTNAPPDTIQVVPFPTGLAVDPLTDTIYVTNQGDPQSANGSVSVTDGRTNTDTPTIHARNILRAD